MVDSRCSLPVIEWGLGSFWAPCLSWAVIKKVCGVFAWLHYLMGFLLHFKPTMLLYCLSIPQAVSLLSVNRLSWGLLVQQFVSLLLFL